ncbi:MAG: hypothetical protein ACYCTL_13680 [Acidimicrobiales bacterium]
MTTPTPVRQTPAEAVAAALAAWPGATATELAEVAGLGRSTAAKTLAAMEREGTAARTDSGRDGGRRLPDRWHRVDPGPVSAKESEVSETVEADGTAVVSVQDGARTEPVQDGARTEPVEVGADRLGKGALRSLVLDYLGVHAGPDGLGPAAVAKGLGGRSSGAVGNALQRLEADGRVRLVSESPRRYVTAG